MTMKIPMQGTKLTLLQQNNSKRVENIRLRPGLEI